jgi:hypothetical protein
MGLFSGGATEEGEEISGSIHETCLVVARPPGREPVCLLRQRGLPGSASADVQALRRLRSMTAYRDLTQMVKERGPQHRTV